MAEETYKIKQHIDREREQLGRNLDEIEYRVKKATDFKTHFDNHTGWILGAAVAGGFLLSLAVRASSPSSATPPGNTYDDAMKLAPRCRRTRNTSNPPFTRRSRTTDAASRITGLS